MRLTELNKRTRDENIRIERTRKREPDKEKGKSTLPKDEIRRQLRRKVTKPKIKKAEKPFIILKPQKAFLAERNYELVEELHKSYISDSKFGDGLKERGAAPRESLKFGHVRDCPRVVNYEFFEPERARDYTAKGLILFEEGKRHHKNIQDRLETRGVLRGSEGFLHIPEINANGFYDGLVPVGSKNGWQICDLVEVKSKLPYACDEIDQVDYDQAQLYHFASQFCPRLKAKKIKVRNIRIFYRDRAIQTDEVDFEWMVKPDLDRQRDIMEYMRFLWNVVVGQKKLVPHPYERKSKKCIYCRFNEWCWREYSEQIVSDKADDFMEAELPEQEIIDSYAKRLYEVLKEEKKLREEKKKIEPILISYFVKTKNPNLPINEREALAPKQGKTSEWDLDALRKAIGTETYAMISKPDSKKITDLIHREFIDAGKFEQFKKYKLSKPSVYIKPIKGGTNNAD